MNNLNVALVQTNIAWENINENLNSLESKLNSLDNSVDLVILPEMFTTGFTMNVESIKEANGGTAFKWMSETAKKNNFAIYGSIISEDNNNIYNRGYFFYPDGSHKHYDKKHLFTLAGEEKVFTAGNQRSILEYKGWKIMPQICYDLRFPVWTRNDLDYDLLIYIASWPERRKHQWSTLLPARAVENMSYVMAVNRVGTDGNNLDYSGNSKAIDFSGEVISSAQEYKEEIVVVQLDKQKQNDFRNKFSFLNDIDDFKISIN